jgi:serine/threonine protein kinase
VSPTLTIGRYEILQTLGSGASGRVDKARDTVIGRTVALKTFTQGFGQDFEQKFLREAQIIGQLSHPSIIRLYDVGTDEHGSAHLVMEYIAGETLESLLKRGSVPIPRACAWAADLVGALAVAHRAGIIHGDVKPGNILVDEEGHVKLGDFGVARYATQVSGSGRVVGTPAYLAPEQILGEKQDQRSDIFALGIVLYEMVTGVRPFDGTSLPAVCAQILECNPVPVSKCNPAVPAELDRIVARCLAKNPRDRYQSGDEMAPALYLFARAKRPGAARPPVPWLSRPLEAKSVMALAALLLLITSGGLAAHSIRQRWRVSPLYAHAAAPPAAPSDLVGYSSTEAVADQEGIPDDSLAAAVRSAPRRLPAAVHVAPRPGVIPKSLDSAQTGAAVPPALTALLPEPARAAVADVALQIDISSSSSEGMLAVFADQKLLFMTQLHSATPSAPLHLEHALPAGPHQLRVALYRPDKSLQAEKEGFAELRADSSNSLGIRVSHRSKLLLLRGNVLDVSWPSAPPSESALDSEHTTAISVNSVTTR